MNEVRKDHLTTADIANPERVDSGEPHYSEAPGGAATAREEAAAPLLSPEETGRFRSRWDSIQVGFVDEPRQAVEQADGLVAEAMKRLAEVFSDERSNLEKQWDRGDNISTEDLRIALRRYRSFFSRLLSV
jgi:hypothetical protein